MASMLPMAMFGLEVPAGDIAVPARAGIRAAFRVTMAAIDPTAEADEASGDAPQRATLKVFRQPLMDQLDEDSDENDEDSEEFDADMMDRILAGEASDDSEDDEEVNGGPSDPAKSKKAKKAAAQAEIKKLLEEGGMDVDDDEEDMPNGVNGTSKSSKALGKLPASDEDEDDDSEDDEDMEDGEIQEFVLCTLDPKQHYQQPLDITIGDNERVWFKVTGTHDIYLTGNYVAPSDEQSGMFEPDSDEDDEYDMEPDEDELDGAMDEDESIDELDDLDDPRITEVEEEEAPPLAKVDKKAEKKANKNKRPAEDDADADAETLDAMIAKAADGANGEVKLSKKQLKKLKKNDGQAAAAPTDADAPTVNGKKVQFAAKLEQGPTPTKETKSEKKADKVEKKDDKPKAATTGTKVVQGVTIEDKKIGTGQAAKSGDRVGMRYIGKLKDNNKVFDSNKKGKPFSFKLGSGEVIKGWDIGLQGIQVGGERRITIPAHLAYGSKKVGNDIPANSTLVFDIKAMEIGKGK